MMIFVRRLLAQPAIRAAAAGSIVAVGVGQLVQLSEQLQKTVRALTDEISQRRAELERVKITSIGEDRAAASFTDAPHFWRFDSHRCKCGAPIIDGECQVRISQEAGERVAEAP